MRAREALVVVSGLLLILAGSFYITGFFPLEGLPLATVLGISLLAAGALLLLLGLAGVRGGSALLLAASLVVLLVVSTGIPVVAPPRAKPVIAEVGPEDVGSITGISLTCHVDFGSVELCTTENRSFYVKFVHHARGGEPLKYSKSDGVLVVNFTSSTSPVEIYIASWLPWQARVSSSFGSIEARLNATLLTALDVRSSFGSINIRVDASELSGNCSVRASTSLGSIELEAVAGPDVGCEIKADTALGSIGSEAEGFETVEKTWNHMLLRSEGFEEATNFISIVLSTSLGSVEVRARRA